jgi:hypothetical protein
VKLRRFVGQIQGTASVNNAAAEIAIERYETEVLAVSLDVGVDLNTFCLSVQSSSAAGIYLTLEPVPAFTLLT